MARSRTPRRLLHPQTVPRGFLRFYILTQLSREPASGYALMQGIEAKTEGAWRPGPGTMYPLLKSLVSDGLARAGGSAGQAGSRAYFLTPKGRRDLEEKRRMMAGVGKNDRTMLSLFSDLLPGKVYVPLMLSRYREGVAIFRDKVSELPTPERAAALRELRFIMETETRWIDSQLSEGLERRSGSTKRTGP